MSVDMIQNSAGLLVQGDLTTRFPGLPNSSAVVGVNLLWKPIKVKLESTLEELDELLEDVEKEADVAEKVESSASRLVVNSHVSGMSENFSCGLDSGILTSNR
jgi:hypothetical protein